MEGNPAACAGAFTRNPMFNRQRPVIKNLSVISTLFNREYGVPYYTTGTESISYAMQHFKLYMVFCTKDELVILNYFN